MTADDLSIEYRSATASSRHVAVNGVTLQLRAGQVLGIIGESGSGKSTLAMALAGLADVRPVDEGAPQICGGSLTVLGTPMRRLGKKARRVLTLRVGYLPQDAAQRLNPGLTVAENVAEPIFLRDRRFDQNEAGKLVATLIDAVHLPLSALGLMTYELSSGQLQRVALARSLILDPELLVADEPIRGVDILVRHHVLNVIPELQAARGFSAVVVSSDLSVVQDVAQRIAVLQDGVIIGLGTLDELVTAPEHPYLKGLSRALASERQPREDEAR
ncbi:peptide ABC transporter ATP-binding protein [Marisediminicola antarctica]|uniref:Peptide ABC transporter ATP-binding protein n=1 Tax=Marisediminicola antarctica TaxID=674079 RepID=A0A7L5ALZ9_9MICO|nr:peptide ABC transporter ATP-binding protein [Marisediminicola antarctica]